MPLKILHTGDLHLGMTFGTRGYPPPLRQQLVEARFAALDNLVEKANGEDCQLFIIAGDLFHRANASQETVLRAAKSLHAFKGACVAVLPGNHDYYDELSPMWKLFRDNSPDHLAFLSHLRPYPLSDYGLEAALYPGPCDAKHSGHNRLGWIKDLQERPAARWHLGVAHGALKGVSPDFDSRYYPMEVEELQALPMDHWFLGHSHCRYPDRDTARGETVTYSGTPEPDGFDCTHDGFAWVTLLHDDGSGESISVAPGQFRFREIHKEVACLEDMETLFRDLPPEKEKTLVKLSLSGTLSQEDYQARLSVYHDLENTLAYLEVEDTSLSLRVTPESIAAEFADGSFPQVLLTRLAARGDEEALQLAYHLVKKVKKC